MDSQNVCIYCIVDGTLPLVTLVGTANKDSSEDIRDLINQIVEIAEIASSTKFLAKFVPHEMNDIVDEIDEGEDNDEDKVKVYINFEFMNNTMKYIFIDDMYMFINCIFINDFFPEEPPI